MSQSGCGTGVALNIHNLNRNCGADDKFSHAVDNGDGTITITNFDGSTVTWAADTDTFIGDFVQTNPNDGDGIITWTAPILDIDGNPTGDTRTISAPEPTMSTTDTDTDTRLTNPRQVGNNIIWDIIDVSTGNVIGTETLPVAATTGFTTNEDNGDNTGTVTDPNNDTTCYPICPTAENKFPGCDTYVREFDSNAKPTQNVFKLGSIASKDIWIPAQLINPTPGVPSAAGTNEDRVETVDLTAYIPAEYKHLSDCMGVYWTARSSATYEQNMAVNQNQFFGLGQVVVPGGLGSSAQVGSGVPYNESINSNYANNNNTNTAPTNAYVGDISNFTFTRRWQYDPDRANAAVANFIWILGFFVNGE